MSVHFSQEKKLDSFLKTCNNPTNLDARLCIYWEHNYLYMTFITEFLSSHHIFTLFTDGVMYDEQGYPIESEESYDDLGDDDMYTHDEDELDENEDETAWE